MPAHPVQASTRYYIGRNPNIVVANLSITREAAALLEELAPTPKSRGAYVTQLLLEERARREERARMKAELEGVLNR